MILELSQRTEIISIGRMVWPHLDTRTDIRTDSISIEYRGQYATVVVVPNIAENWKSSVARTRKLSTIATKTSCLGQLLQPTCSARAYWKPTSKRESAMCHKSFNIYVSSTVYMYKTLWSPLWRSVISPLYKSRSWIVRSVVMVAYPSQLRNFLSVYR